jgi:hypothetical protein
MSTLNARPLKRAWPAYAAAVLALASAAVAFIGHSAAPVCSTPLGARSGISPEIALGGACALGILVVW